MGAPAIFEKQIEIKLLHPASTLESRAPAIFEKQIEIKLFHSGVTDSGIVILAKTLNQGKMESGHALLEELATAVYNHSLSFNRYQTLFFQAFKYPADHFA
ncbi:MAG: hypothetical protein P8X74_08835 [Reinekea sp.]